MKAPTGYEINALLHSGPRSEILKALRISDQQSVIIKRSLQPAIAGKAFQREMKLAAKLKSNNIIKYHGIERWQDQTGKEYLAIILEDFGGEPLAGAIPESGYSLDEFLRIGFALMDGLEEIHDRNIIHKDINPSNILLNNSLGAVKFIDFRMASLLKREIAQTRYQDYHDGNRSYAAPEQHVVNRALDYRADIYSLGVTFFQMLIGHLPDGRESSLDSSFNLHAHNPLEYKPDLPRALANIVMKMTEPNAEDRYQGIRGIRHDLFRLQRTLQNEKKVIRFSLGKKDFSDRFLSPHKVYGRTRELNRLKAQWEWTLKGGRSFVVLSGEAGVGKTALANEIMEMISRGSGACIRGGFEPFRQGPPYGALSDALRERVRGILADSVTSGEPSSFRSDIAQTLGENVAYLFDFIPELRLLSDRSDFAPRIPARGDSMPGYASQNEEAGVVFGNVLKDFIQLLAHHEGALFIFLDNLHWAGREDMALIESLASSRDLTHVFFLGASRDNQTMASGFLGNNSSYAASPMGGPEILHLGGLNREDIQEFLSGCFRCGVNILGSLSRQVYLKTGGVPLFVKEFVNILRDKKLIEYGYLDSIWIWDLEAIHLEKPIADVEELARIRHDRLSPRTLKLLRPAACLGKRFNLRALAEISGKSFDETVGRLWPAVSAGVITLERRGAGASAGEYFTGSLTEYTEGVFEENVWRMIYNHLPERERKEHWRTITTYLMGFAENRNLDDDLFVVIRQLNRGRRTLESSREKERLSALNMKAARKAWFMNSSESLTYFSSIARELNPELEIENLVDVFYNNL